MEFFSQFLSDSVSLIFSTSPVRDQTVTFKELYACLCIKTRKAIERY